MPAVELRMWGALLSTPRSLVLSLKRGRSKNSEGKNPYGRDASPVCKQSNTILLLWAASLNQLKKEGLCHVH